MTCSTSCRNAQDVPARQVRNAKCTRPSSHELCFVARWPFLKGCQRSKERAAGSTGSIQAVCALLHHVSSILNDQVLSFVQHELAEVSEEGFTDILSKDSKVIICNLVHWHFDVALFRLSELIFSVRTQESLHSWTTAVNNAEIIFENVNILTRDIQVRFHAFLFSIRWIASDFELFFAPGTRSISIYFSTLPVNGSEFRIAWMKFRCADFPITFPFSSAIFFPTAFAANKKMWFSSQGNLAILRALFAQLVERFCEHFLSVRR